MSTAAIMNSTVHRKTDHPLGAEIGSQYAARQRGAIASNFCCGVRPVKMPDDDAALVKLMDRHGPRWKFATILVVKLTKARVITPLALAIMGWSGLDAIPRVHPAFTLPQAWHLGMAGRVTGLEGQGHADVSAGARSERQHERERGSPP